MKRINPLVKTIANLFRPGDFKYREVLKLYGNVAVSKTLFQHREDGSEKEIATIDYVEYDLDWLESTSLYNDIDAMDLECSNNIVEIFDGQRKDDSLDYDFYIHKIGDTGDKFHILNSYYDPKDNNSVYCTEECWYSEEDELMVGEELSYKYDYSGRIVEVIDTRVETECIEEEEYLDMSDYSIFRYDQNFMRADYKYTFKYDDTGRVIESTVIMASEDGATMTLISNYIYDESVSLQEYNGNPTVAVFPTVICKDIVSGNFIISDDIISTQSLNANPHVPIDGYVESATDRADDVGGIEIVRYIKKKLYDEGHSVCSLYDDNLMVYWVHMDEYKNPSLL